MKLKKFILTNFRGYATQTEVSFDNLIAIVGKNDSGKSSILDALDIFFNKNNACNKLDFNDINQTEKSKDNLDIEFRAIFTDLPEELILDSSYPTTLEKEHLLNEDGDLEIVKKYTNGSDKEKISICANHPNIPNIDGPLLLKNSKELKKIIDDYNIPCSNKSINAVMRAAIWSFFSDSSERIKTPIPVPTNKKDDPIRDIWSKIEPTLPIYSLFQADRTNRDSDEEVQDPLKRALQEFISEPEIQKKLKEIANQVLTRLQDVSERTLEKLKEMDPSVANTLQPQIPPAEELKWESVFKNVSITGDNGIPINKRGSGIKRLILLNFFRAEAERRRDSQKTKSIIYAIEEPETSQHTTNQLKLISALKDLSLTDNTQIIITTHSPHIVKSLDFEKIRSVQDEGTKTIKEVEPARLVIPSLNEINYCVFGEPSTEYHDELFAYIDELKLLREFEQSQKPVQYLKKNRDGTSTLQMVSLSSYIRHQIHHPENKFNETYSQEDLFNSIKAMRMFIAEHLTKGLSAND